MLPLRAELRPVSHEPGGPLPRLRGREPPPGRDGADVGRIKRRALRPEGVGVLGQGGRVNGEQHRGRAAGRIGEQPAFIDAGHRVSGGSFARLQRDCVANLEARFPRQGFGQKRLSGPGGAAGKQRDVLQRKGFACIGPGLHRRAVRQRGGLQAAGQAGGVKFGVGEQGGGFLGRALLDVQVPGAGLGLGRAVERPHDRMAADEHGGEQRGREQHPEHRDEEPRPAAADLAQRELPQQGHGRITSSFAILPSSIESTRSACRARPRSWVMSSIVWL